MTKKRLDHNKNTGRLLEYKMIKRLSEAVVVLSWKNGINDLWSRTKIRKCKNCEITDEKIDKGEYAWIPITNGYNRMHRISDAGIIELENLKGANL